MPHAQSRSAYESNIRRPSAQEVRSAAPYNPIQARMRMEAGRNFSNFRAPTQEDVQAAVAAVSRPGSGGRRAGGGSGGGGGSAKPAPIDKTPLKPFQIDELNAALDAISARFGRERTGLEQQRGAIRRAFELLSADFDEREDEELERSGERSSSAGRLRSGLFLEQQADIADQFADAMTRARADRDSRLAPIEQALASLEARRESARAARARELAREFLGTREAIAQALELV